MWDGLPEGCKSEARKSDMAQCLLKQAADGVRDPITLRASALGCVADPSASVQGKGSAKKRPRITHQASFDQRLVIEAQRLKEQANTFSPGKDRELLLRRARQAETAAHINEWLTSPGLMSPK